MGKKNKLLKLARLITNHREGGVPCGINSESNSININGHNPQLAGSTQ